MLAASGLVSVLQLVGVTAVLTFCAWKARTTNPRGNP